MTDQDFLMKTMVRISCAENIHDSRNFMSCWLRNPTPQPWLGCVQRMTVNCGSITPTLMRHSSASSAPFRS